MFDSANLREFCRAGLTSTAMIGCSILIGTVSIGSFAAFAPRASEPELSEVRASRISTPNSESVERNLVSAFTGPPFVDVSNSVAHRKRSSVVSLSPLSQSFKMVSKERTPTGLQPMTVSKQAQLTLNAESAGSTYSLQLTEAQGELSLRKTPLILKPKGPFLESRPLMKAVSDPMNSAELDPLSDGKLLSSGFKTKAPSAKEAASQARLSAELSSTLSGTVYHWSKHALIEDVTVADASTLSATTDAQGAYSFTNMSAGTYSLSATKTPDPSDLDRTITSADALAALKIAVGLNPNNDPEGDLGPLPVSAYQLVSADINGDGRVTSSDALGILKMAVGLSDAPEARWVFVADQVPVWTTNNSRYAVYQSGNASDVVFPEQSETHYAAILVGDVNASWQAPAGSLSVPSDILLARAQASGAPTSLWGIRDLTDTEAAVITVMGGIDITHEQGTVYRDAGARAIDDVDGEIIVTTTGAVGSAAGVYTLTYQATDAAGNIASATRTVTVEDTQPPVVTLAGASSIEITLGTTFTDPGASALDTADGALSVSVSGTVENAPGVYTLTYTATDVAGNSASVSRTVTVTGTSSELVFEVLDEGQADAKWDLGIKAFDGALGYSDCTMSGPTECQSLSWQTIQDSERGTVLQVKHNAGAELAGLFVQTSNPIDLSGYAEGALEFDIKVVSGDSRITMKLDCVFPCTSDNKPLGALGTGDWVTVRIALSDLTATGLDLTKISTGIVIWATAHNNTVFLLDNIRFTETLLGEPYDLVGGGGGSGGPVGVDYTLIPYGAGSISDTINPASYRCVYDYGNWIYNAGIVRPGIAGCETATQTPIGEPSPLSPNLVEPASLSPTPTHKWWGSIPFLGEMTIGDPNSAAYITPDPLTVRITNGGFRAMGIPNGLRVVNPNEFAYPIPDPFGEVMDGIAIGHSSGTNLQGYLKDHSDGSVTVQWQNAGVAVMEATFVHGSPYVYLEVLSGDLVIKTLRPDGGEKGVFYQQGSSLGVWTSVAGNHNNYLISGEGATTFSGVESDRINASNNSGKYTLTYLPQTSGEPNLAMIQAFLSKALKRVAKVDITYSVDRSTNAVAITHTYRDDAGQPVDTMVGMLPLHWKNAQNVLSNYSVRSARGVTKFVEQSTFTYTIPYGGALPALPTLPGTVDQTVLAAKVQSFLDQGESSWNTYNDAYWSGKNYSKVAELIAITRSVGMTVEADRLTVWLKSQLEDWFNAERDGQLDTQYYFMYDDEWNTLLAMEESFASHQNLNDHHFHYGYLVRAAVEVCRTEPAWCGDDQYGPMIELLIRDYAAGRDDPMFPYLRHFDPANGFSWASGNVNFARGNNNESTSEAANAYGAMVLFGLIRGDDAMVERGMYLHASTAAAYWEYWNNIDGYRGETGEKDNFPPGYDKISTSIIWGDGAVFSTWFSAAYAHILGIQGLPSNPLILHVGLYSDYMQDYVALGLSESSNGKPSGLPDDQWRDLWWNLWALANPGAALADYESMSNYIPEQGESLAHTYHWLHTFAELGQLQTGTGVLTADYPAAMVFDNAGVKTYVVYNYGSDVRQVSFSDGVVVNAAAGQFTVYRQ